MAGEAKELRAPAPRTGLWAVMRRELHIVAHSPFYLLFVFVLPLVSFGILWTIFYYEIPREMPIVVHDGDNSKISRQLVRMADASAQLNVVATVDNIEEGAGYIRRGKAYAILYIPADLEHDVKRAQSPPVTVFFNNQWFLVSGLISRAMREVVGTLSAGLDLRSRMMKGENPAQAWEHYEPIRADQHPLFNPNMNYRYFLLPGLLPTLVQVFVLMVTARAIGGELKHGTAGEWLAVGGGRPWLALLGKLIPYTLFFWVLIVFMLALLVRFSGVPAYGSLELLILASLLFVMAYQAMGFFMVAVSANLRMANSLAGFYGGPAFAFAGLTYPMIGMPLAAKLWGHALPLSHYLRVLLQQALRGSPVQASMPSVIILGLFIIVPPMLLLPRMGRLMRDSKYWGRI